MNARPSITLRQAEDLTLDVFERVAWDGDVLGLDPTLLKRIADSRARMLDVLAGGANVYGITTGMGYLANVRLSDEEQRAHQANLLMGRAVGGPPFLDRTEVRALMLARLAGFLSGHACVTPELCLFLVGRLNDDFVPAIPRTGIGCAGEIIPLSHAFQTFMGVGHVISADATVSDAASALTARGIAPYEPATKEGIALLAGAPGAAALAAGHRRAGATLARQLLVSAACAIDAMRAPLGPYDPAIARLSHDPVMKNLLERLGILLAGSQTDRPQVQSPVSFRVIPQVLAHLDRTLGRFDEDICRALTAVTDSPTFVDDHFVSTGAFHAIDLAAGMDGLCVALVHAAELTAQRIHRLLDHRFSDLPDQLTPTPGPHAGLIVVQKRVVGAVHELRRLASPGTVGLSDTSLGQEDAMTFTFEVAEKLLRVEALTREIIASELMVARQAWFLRGVAVARGLREQAHKLETTVEAVDHDRPLGADIATIIELLDSGAFQDAFGPSVSHAPPDP